MVYIAGSFIKRKRPTDSGVKPLALERRPSVVVTEIS
jgi:hypothetical protein